MRPVLVAVVMVLALIAGCSRGSGTAPYTNDKYGFTVEYPAAWKVNKVQMAPPPPAGTSFRGNNVTMEITVWQSPANTGEQASLRQDGWLEENITVAGEKALSFTRPASDRQKGVWRRVYFEHKGLSYELTLNVYDQKQGESAHQVFNDLLHSMRWIATPTEAQPASGAPDAATAAIPAVVTGLGNLGPGPFAFADPSHGWTALGSSIFATGDGGKTWRPVGSLEGVRSMAFTTVENGWAATDTALYATRDGGASWQSANVTAPDETWEIAFSPDGRHGAVAGRGGMILTRDGGASWNEVQTSCTSLQWVGDAIAYGACGSLGASWQLQRSADGGQIWTPVSSPCSERWSASSSFVGPETGFMLCGGQPGAGTAAKALYATTDGGKSWEKRAYADHGTTGRIEHGLPLGGYPAGLFFLDERHGWLPESRGGLLATDDGGYTWHGLNLPLTGEAFLGKVHFFNLNDGSVIASEGGRPHLLSTHDGGRRWSQILPALAPAVGAPLTLFSATRGLALGTFTDPGAFLATDDGGSTWRQVGQLPGSHPVALSFPDPAHGWVLMETWDHQSGDKRTLYATADGGATWRPLKSLGPPGDGGEFFGDYLSFVDDQTGYVWGPDLRVTHDGGVTFTSMGKPDGFLRQWVTPAFGWSVNGGELAVTRDGGKTTAWVTAPCRLYPAQALSDGTIWATSQNCPGGPTHAVLVSHDYGARWTVYDLGDTRVSRVVASSDREAWLTDELGQVYTTADSGRSWTQVAPASP